MPFGLPKSLIWFAATGAVYLLQLFPYTGIFLMFALAQFWSVILVNVGFVSLALEALARPRHILWLIAPALYFVGYAGAAYLSHAEFDRIDAELHEHNAKAMAAAPQFDHSRNDLVVVRNSYRTGGVARALVSRFGLAVAYETNPHYKTAEHVGYWLGSPSVCQQIRANPEARPARVNASFVRGKGRPNSAPCQISGPADPIKPVILLELEENKDKYWLLPTTFHTLTLRYPMGETVTLRTGYAAPLPWLPLPVMGCFLNSGGPSWDCSVGFNRFRQKGLGAEGACGAGNASIVAQALGLQEASPGDQAPKAQTTLPAALGKSISDRLSISQENLERIIDDPTVRLTVHDITGLHQRVDIWRDRIPAMLDALERAFDTGGIARERANILQDLLLRLDNDSYELVNRRLLGLLAARPDLDARFVRSDTFTRLGELGAPAVPVLEGHLLRRPRPDIGIMLGLCRAGAAAAGVSNEIVRRTTGVRDSDRGRRFAAHLTLHRLGVGNQAANVIGESHRIPQDLLDRIADTLTPASPASVCISYSNWHERLRRERSPTR